MVACTREPSSKRARSPTASGGRSVALHHQNFCTQRFSPHPEGKLSTIAGRALQAPVDRGTLESFRFSGEHRG